MESPHPPVQWLSIIILTVQLGRLGTQRDEVTCPRSRSKSLAELEIDSRSAISQDCALTTALAFLHSESQYWRVCWERFFICRLKVQASLHQLPNLSITVLNLWPVWNPLILNWPRLQSLFSKLWRHHYNNITLHIATQCFQFGIQIMCTLYKRLSTVNLRNTYALSNCVGFLFPAWCTNYSL